MDTILRRLETEKIVKEGFLPQEDTEIPAAGQTCLVNGIAQPLRPKADINPLTLGSYDKARLEGNFLTTPAVAFTVEIHSGISQKHPEVSKVVRIWIECFHPSSTCC